jgi:hypothetical protein
MEEATNRPYLVAVAITMLVEVSDPAVLADRAGDDARSSWAGPDAPVQLIQHALHPEGLLADLGGVRFIRGSVEASRAGFRD